MSFFLRNPKQPKASSTLYNVICSVVEPMLSPRQKIEAGRAFIFDFDYNTPEHIDKNDFKSFFETCFISNYLTRYFAYETYDLFKIKLESEVKIKMLDYSKKMSLFYDKDFNGKSSTETVSTGKNKNLDADLPVGIIQSDDIDDVHTASAGSMGENENTTTQTTYSVDSVIKSSDYFNDLFTSLINEFDDLFATVVPI